MGRSSSTQTLEGDQRISQTNKNQPCSALLLCLPLWPSLLLSQKLTPNSFTATSLLYQFKYMNPHHTEGMTKQGVPEDTDSVKLAKEQHKFAQQVEKVNKVQYVAPYTTYAGYPYVHHPVATHFIAKREAEAEADPAVFYNAYNGVYSPYVSTYSAYPYTTAVAGYPYNKVYTTGYTGYTYNTPVVHALGKREAEADSDAALYYRTYGYNYGSPYTYNYGTPYTYGAYPYRNVYGAWY